ncbi:polyprenyl diphosphate synthase [Thiomicrorhabdus sp. zzn3]|uniref:polyprenyl diphosphate synthase n=1 Tax=Thiomicrorhabdus sp. zzn3 TaxID=3039775 RepID=UPI002436B585|nr:polyprenyl diphosphate synthase [Thiomicrorhabdus sp. zzn3]MDG6777980.1 polyprenyl diphosphate synthase [Thiomicrorhabdus sp. zzn3]
MDGNGRWAKKRLLPRFIGHQKGLNAVKRIVAHCAEQGIEALTLFAFSTENWRRPEEEVTKLMGLFLKALKKEIHKLDENNVRLQIVGERSAFSEEIQHYIEEAERKTASNSGLTLNIAANYGGRWDIIQAVKQWQADNPRLSISDLNEDAINAYISLSNLPEPDLLIRTGGEQRISNFLIWQMAYTEFYFTDTLWPDFDEKALERALDSFGSRERRFGQTGDQVKPC